MNYIDNLKELFNLKAEELGLRDRFNISTPPGQGAASLEIDNIRAVEETATFLMSTLMPLISRLEKKFLLAEYLECMPPADIENIAAVIERLDRTPPSVREELASDSSIIRKFKLRNYNPSQTKLRTLLSAINEIKNGGILSNAPKVEVSEDYASPTSNYKDIKVYIKDPRRFISTGDSLRLGELVFDFYSVLFYKKDQLAALKKIKQLIEYLDKGYRTNKVLESLFAELGVFIETPSLPAGQDENLSHAQTALACIDMLRDKSNTLPYGKKDRMETLLNECEIARGNLLSAAIAQADLATIRDYLLLVCEKLNSAVSILLSLHPQPDFLVDSIIDELLLM